jgi:hypothetical protein
MARPLLASLTVEQAAAVLRDVIYLNMQELRRLCDAHGIPYAIHFEQEGRIIRSRDLDRKGIVINRLVRFLKTGAIGPPTLFPASVVSSAKSRGTPKEDDRVLYGGYRNRDPATLRLMKSLTNGKFEFGAIAQEVTRACWSKGRAPTYAEFARLWLKAAADHVRPNPEWAFLTDRAEGRAGADWKRVRTRKAADVLALLKKAGAAR